MLINITFALAIAATSVSAAFVALLMMSAMNGRARVRRTLTDTSPPPEEVVFLFDDHELVDASGPARALLNATPLRGTDWERLRAFLVPRFHQFDARISTLASDGKIEMSGVDDKSLLLFAEHVGGLARITLVDPKAEGQGRVVDSLSLRAMEDELVSLRKSVDAAPLLVWRQDTTGEVVWANRAYLLESGALEAEDGMTWPLPQLFKELAAVASGGTARRLKLEKKAGGKAHWFDCHTFPTHSGTLHFAMPADTTVHAELALREFVQTLTKTFAHLPIGLAIFDRNRQLALFNPALTDLTTLSAEFLTGRPTLFAVLDRLREARMIPEPKNYTLWRKQMNELEAAAANGLYQETWALASGQTFRVTGRPHTEGAVAFLIEDITAEVSMTRRYRSELQLSQTVIDAMDEAIAVFSPAGVLILSNSAYVRLWGSDPGTTLGEVGVGDAMRDWQSQTLASPIWAEARDFVGTLSGREAWGGQAKMKDHRVLTCRFVPLSGGATLVSFMPPRPVDKDQTRTTQPKATRTKAAAHSTTK